MKQKKFPLTFRISLRTCLVFFNLHWHLWLIARGFVCMLSFSSWAALLGLEIIGMEMSSSSLWVASFGLEIKGMEMSSSSLWVASFGLVIKGMEMSSSFLWVASFGFEIILLEDDFGLFCENKYRLLKKLILWFKFGSPFINLIKLNNSLVKA